VDDTNCSRPVGTNATITENIERWKCQVARALGPSASAAVTYANNGDVTVTIAWGDQRWDPENPDEKTSFVLETRL